jgi:hypothetical protein
MGRGLRAEKMVQAERVFLGLGTPCQTKNGDNGAYGY